MTRFVLIFDTRNCLKQRKKRVFLLGLLEIEMKSFEDYESREACSQGQKRAEQVFGNWECWNYKEIQVGGHGARPVACKAAAFVE
jgi:hypothetical protein